MSELHDWAKTAAGNDTGAVPDFPVEDQAPSTVNDCMRNNMAAVAKDRELRTGELTTGGTGNAYTLATTTSFAALADLPALVFRADRANTGAATLAVDGLTAKAIVGSDGTALVANDILANQIVAAVYNSVNDNYQIVSGRSNVVTETKTQTLTNKTLTSPVVDAASSSLKPLVKDHGTKSGNYTLQMDEADVHLVAFSATATLTIASANTNDKAAVVVKNGGNAITLSGIDNDSPTLTNGASKQDFIGLVKSFGKISTVAAVLNKGTV